ncbi:MAG: flagellar biosynthesis protein FlgM, partial [Candidatus Omnitrophica bacterium]|nr:flagellar biosynthesis protein FlgM [Candidatus Omnitrophota bacterium]
MMWLWDSVFNALGLKFFYPEIAWELIASVLEQQKKDGMIAHLMYPDGQTSQITQPPVLAWGCWQIYQTLKDKNILRYSLPRLEKYLTWDLTHRDNNKNGLLEWHLVANKRCRCGESGLDNSPRFDLGTPLDAVDFSVFASQDMKCLSLIAEELGNKERASFWLKKSQALAEKILDYFWDETTGFFYDKDLLGNFVRLKSCTGFLPLLLEVVPQAKIERLAACLENPEEFGTAFPVPTVAANEPSWSRDMWRGPTWINIDYLIICGLRKHGQEKLAERLANILIEKVLKYYEKSGVIFEFYDSADKVAPEDLDRKGKRVKPYDIRVKVDAIRDYNWSASL